MDSHIVHWFHNLCHDFLHRFCPSKVSQWFLHLQIKPLPAWAPILKEDNPRQFAKFQNTFVRNFNWVWNFNWVCATDSVLVGLLDWICRDFDLDCGNYETDGIMIVGILNIGILKVMCIKLFCFEGDNPKIWMRNWLCRTEEQ